MPAGTPAGVVEKIAKDNARTSARLDVRDELAKHGADPMSMTHPEFACFVWSESKTRRISSKPLGSNLTKLELPTNGAPDCWRMTGNSDVTRLGKGSRPLAQ